jgi:GTP pyrophosphokinase
LKSLIHHPTYSDLAAAIGEHLIAGDRETVRRAYEVAETAHARQTRDEGTPYIVHPLRVAISLVAELDVASPELISAALLHDVIEDSDITREEIAEMFGDDTAAVVWLLTKLDHVSVPDYLAAIESAAETGAPVVKLCDRLDNLRFLLDSPRLDKRHHYIWTTERYYLPLASRTNQYLYDELRKWIEVVRRRTNLP